MRRLDPKFVWVFFLKRMIAFVALFFVVVFLVWLMSITPAPEGRESVNAVGDLFLSILRPIYSSPAILVIVFAVISVIFFISSWLTYHFFWYELTDESIKKELGVISKHYATVTLDRVQNVNIRRGLIERMFGLSTLEVLTAGTMGAELVVPGLSQHDAEQLREDIIARMKAIQNKERGL